MKVIRTRRSDFKSLSFNKVFKIQSLLNRCQSFAIWGGSSTYVQSSERGQSESSHTDNFDLLNF